MVVTIEDRRVTSIPAELECELKVDPFCVTCKNKGSDSLSVCSRCKLVKYCCRECQKRDFARHKKEDDCVGIGNLKQNLEALEDMIQNNGCLLMQEMMINFDGDEDTWLGRGEPSLMEMMGLMSTGLIGPDGGPTTAHMPGADYSRNIMDVIAGRFGALQGTGQYMQCMMALNNKIITLAHNHNSLEAYEEVLKLAVETKRLTHAVYPDVADRELPKLLMKLHRDDDAIGYILHWIQWRSHGPRNLHDPLVLLSSKGEWPFPCEKDCRLLDITQEIRDCHFPEGDDMAFPAPYALVALIVKVRLICVHDILVSKARAFLRTELDLPQDVKTAIVSFVTGGDEATALNEELLRQANQLMDYIDESYPAILKGTLDTSLLPAPAPGKDGVDDDQAFDVRGFMGTFADGLPIVLKFRDMLRERYGFED
jgi:hypothetical protein